MQATKRRPSAQALRRSVVGFIGFVIAVGCNGSDSIKSNRRRDTSLDSKADTSQVAGASQIHSLTAPSDGTPTGSALGSAGSASASPECTPKCGAECGVDNGCGQTCGCAAGMQCSQGVCVSQECGLCRPNERCQSGKCACVPDCVGHDCQPDGCGNSCPCPDGQVVNDRGQSVPSAECTASCAEAGWQCGVLCGVDCGTCTRDQACKNGRCVCAPKCDGTSCSDGCGGTCDCETGTVCDPNQQCVLPQDCRATCESQGLTCGEICGLSCGNCGNGMACIEGQCREAVSCTDCNLALRLLKQVTIGGRLARVKLAVDFQGASEAASPRLADIRLGADHPIGLVEARLGAALQDTGKELFIDEVTHQPWQNLGDGTYQLLAYSVAGTLRVKPGRLMTLTFDLAESGSVRFQLVRHAQVFAPLDANAALQASAYDQVLVVTP